MKVWCVRYIQSADGPGWCATFRGHGPSKDAVNDRTACGEYVTLRVDSEKRTPTCKKCKEAVARRRSP